MNDQNQPYQPPEELTQHFWQAWREQVTKTPRLAHRLLQSGRELLERFQHFYTMVCKAPRPLRRRWQGQLGASLAGVALALALSNASVQAANFTANDAATLVAAITAANDEVANPGPDTITLSGNVTLTAVNNVTSGGNGLPLITSEITIEGAGFTIARNAGAPSFRILRVDASGNLTLNNTTITGGNAVPYQGGGVYNNSGGTLTISNSTISGNSGQNGGGILSRGTLVINNSTISGNNGGSNNSGGGIHASGTLVINNSTISGNSSRFAGGIFGNGIVTLSNSTVSGNIANSSGGGIYNFGTLTLEQSLITGNTAPISQEIQNYGDSYASGTINSNNFNLFGHSGQSNAQAFDNFTPSGSDIIATSDGTTPTALTAILDTTLQVNAPGDTATHALVTGSPAIDAAPSGPATDQRGVARPQGCAFDIGAFELGQAPCVVNEPPVANAGPDQTVFRNDVVTVSGTWTDPNEAADNPYTWSWDLTGDTLVDDSGTANYGDTIVRTTSFVVDGVATLTFSVTDKDGTTDSDTVQITVVNRAPTANNQSVSTDEDTPLPITLTASDADGDTLVYTLLDLPDHGILSGMAPNLTYTPDPDYFAPSGHPDSFTFQVNDGLADSNIATVSINVNPVNDPPVAVDDTATTLKNVPVTIAVQANDSAGPANEDQTLTTTAVTAPANGAAVINPDGSVTYTPNFNFYGIDSFASTVCDSDGACATATVTVLVEWTNAPPTAVDDSVTTNEETPVTFDVLANDSDVDGNLNPGSVTVVSGPSNGALVHNGAGSFTYTPAANFSGVDSFVYEVCDTEGVCASATVTITVLYVNKPPVCTGASPSVAVLWPPNHQFVPVTVNGVIDIEGDPITIAITSIFQDEPTNGTGDGDTSPDGQGIGSGSAQVRAERAGGGNGRFYHISFSASDDQGGSCNGVVKVSVPKSMGKNGAAVDDGALYDSTQP